MPYVQIVRNLVRGAAWATLGLLALALVLAVGWYLQADTGNVGREEFTTPLRIPPLAPSVTGPDGERVFDLTAQVGTSELVPGLVTETWGVNGSNLGPTIKASRGERVVINVRNDLPEATSMHWHGAHLPAEMDGGPHQAIAPGATWSPTWTIDQPAATLWYHPHLHTETAEHVYRGVAGMFLVDDERSAELGLPGRYGVDDVPVIIQDKKITPSGELDLGNTLLEVTGILGDQILVNGTRTPRLDVDARVVRLRLLNASNARFYNLGFVDDRTMQLVGTDGGLRSRPLAVERLLLSPGERAEVLVAMEPGDDTILRSHPADLDANAIVARMAGAHDTFDVLRVVAAGDLRPAPELPDELVAVPEAEEPVDVTTRTFELGDFTINGETMAMARIDEHVPAGSTEVWEVVNGSLQPHNFHIHGLSFRVLDVEGETPGDSLVGSLKDTVFVAPGSRVRLLARFPEHVGHHPYMFHCHLLYHEDNGMMGQYATTPVK